MPVKTAVRRQSRAKKESLSRTLHYAVPGVWAAEMAEAQERLEAARHVGHGAAVISKGHTHHATAGNVSAPT
jgi:hypothetical protein